MGGHRSHHLSPCDAQPRPPARCTTAGGRVQPVGVVVTSGQQPGREGVRVPHLAGALLVAAPGGVGKLGDQVEQLQGTNSVGADALRAGHGLSAVRDHSVAPAVNLIAEVPRRAQRRQPDRAFAHDASGMRRVAPDRSHLDHEATSVEPHLQGGVIQVPTGAVLVVRHECLEGTAASSNARVGIAGSQRQPVAGQRSRARGHPGPSPFIASSRLSEQERRCPW